MKKFILLFVFSIFFGIKNGYATTEKLIDALSALNKKLKALHTQCSEIEEKITWERLEKFQGIRRARWNELFALLDSDKQKIFYSQFTPDEKAQLEAMKTHRHGGGRRRGGGVRGWRGRGGRHAGWHAIIRKRWLVLYKLLTPKQRKDIFWPTLEGKK